MIWHTGCEKEMITKDKMSSNYQYYKKYMETSEKN